MIKTKITQHKKKETKPKYPYLGKDKNSNLVVYICDEYGGVVLIPNDEYQIGEILPPIDERDFIKFEGEITLSNDN